MVIVFDRGSKERVKGHALLYFRSSLAQDEIWVTYLVILPISVDVSKYVPPFLMNQVADLGSKDLSAFAFPPAPERLASYQALEKIADNRDDDILFGGTINPNDVPSAMMAINETVQLYAEMYFAVADVPTQVLAAEEGEPGEIGVNEVLYGLMSDEDRLKELTKLVGLLRFAVEGSDAAMTKEAEHDIAMLSKHLPDNHSIPELMQAVGSNDIRSAELADLYLQRCFHLVKEEYAKVIGIEAEIAELERERRSEQ